MNQKHIAISMFIGCCLVALAIVLPNKTTQNLTSGQNQEASGEVKRNDYQHLYGSPDATITIVEFSDFECPFCAQLQQTLKKIVDDSNEKISWEYRHLPLPNHTNAYQAAVASECVADQMGEEAFMLFSETLFENIGKANAAFLESAALALGVDKSKYQSCLLNTEVQARVESDAAAARVLGGKGTPFSIIMSTDGTMRPVSGALPYNDWMNILSTLK